MNQVLTLSAYNSDSIRIGDLVSDEVIDYLRNNLIPATDWSMLFQSGGIACDHITEDGHLRPAFSTFKRIASGVWCYCGSCLRGESKERGELPEYERI